MEYSLYAGVVQNTLLASDSLNLTTLWGVVIISIFQMNKLRLTEMKDSVQGIQLVSGRTGIQTQFWRTPEHSGA